MRFLSNKKTIATLSFTAILLSANLAMAGKPDKPDSDTTDPNLEALTVVSTVSSVDGAISGFRCADGSVTGDPADACGVQAIIYPIVGKVFAPAVNPLNGETIGAPVQIGTINATPEFDVGFFALNTEDWTTLGTLPWTMSTFSMKVNGSTFEYVEGMALNGTAFAALGPVENPYTSENGASLRMGGCEGIREVSGKGQHADMIGTLCLNGTFSFQPNFDGKGVSNCTLVLHNKW